MKTRLAALLGLAILAVAGSAALGAPGYMQLAAPARQLGVGDDFPDMWEYVYDVHGETAPVDFVSLSGFDASAIENQWPWEGWGRTGTLLQKWDWHIGHYAPSWERGAYGSYAVGGAEPWILPDEPWSIDNPWHRPNEYSAVGTTYPSPAFIWAGKIAEDGQSLTFISSYKNRVASGLLLTFRIVHPNAPGVVDYSVYSYYGEDVGNGTITGPSDPPPPPLGSFDGDQDVDDIDIDLLCDAIRTGSINFALFDISANGTTAGTDGVIDTKDLDFLVRFLVYTTVGEGTEYGDFNLDGVIDTTDLTRLATNYGDDDWMWDDGNANRNIDTNIDNTDLTILATYYGFVAPDVVPEPVTLSLLAVGAAALLRPRRVSP